MWKSIDRLTNNSLFYVQELGVKGCIWISVKRLSSSCLHLSMWEKNQTKWVLKVLYFLENKNRKALIWLCLASELILETIVSLSSLESGLWVQIQLGRISLGYLVLDLRRFVLNRPQFLSTHFFFVFLLIRVKFSTEKDAVLFALKVSLFFWKMQYSICFLSCNTSGEMLMWLLFSLSLIRNKMKMNRDVSIWNCWYE